MGQSISVSLGSMASPYRLEYFPLVNTKDNRIIIDDQGGESRATDRILATVTSMLETGGTDAVELAKVARQARVSMTTIYKYFGSRDELILAAIETWMEDHVYRPVARS